MSSVFTTQVSDYPLQLILTNRRRGHYGKGERGGHLDYTNPYSYGPKEKSYQYFKEDGDAETLQKTRLLE